MSVKLSKIRLVSVNGLEVIADRGTSYEEIKNWFERVEEREVDEILPLALTAKPDASEKRAKTYAEIIESREFAAEDLPMFL